MTTTNDPVSIVRARRRVYNQNVMDKLLKNKQYGILNFMIPVNQVMVTELSSPVRVLGQGRRIHWQMGLSSHHPSQPRLCDSNVCIVGR
jgi:hypothetical protein